MLWPAMGRELHFCISFPAGRAERDCISLWFNLLHQSASIKCMEIMSKKLYVCCQMCFICRYLVWTISRVVWERPLRGLMCLLFAFFLEMVRNFADAQHDCPKFRLVASPHEWILLHPLDHPLAASADAEWHLDARIKLRSICLRHTAVSNLSTTYVCTACKIKSPAFACRGIYTV